MEQKLEQNDRGNTKSRSYFFTFWEENKEVYEFIEEWGSGVAYIIVGGIEKTKNGKEHRHGCIWYDNPRSFNKMKEKYPKTHIERCRSIKKSQIYSCKDAGEVLIEKGTPPRGIDIQFMSKRDIIELDPRCHKSLLEAKNKMESIDRMNEMLNEARKGDVKKSYVCYIQGSTGKGKTKTAIKMAIDEYKNEDISFVSFENGFMNAVNESAKCLILMEFRPSDIKADRFLEFLDRYGCEMNTKGSHCFIRPEKIYICSIVKIDELYKNEEINGQFKRRMDKIIDLGYDNNNIILPTVSISEKKEDKKIKGQDFLDKIKNDKDGDKYYMGVKYI